MMQLVTSPVTPMTFDKRSRALVTRAAAPEATIRSNEARISSTANQPSRDRMMCIVTPSASNGGVSGYSSKTDSAFGDRCGSLRIAISHLSATDVRLGGLRP